MHDTHITLNKALAWDLLFNMFQPPSDNPCEESEINWRERERMLDVLKMAEECSDA
jgi:hypothetical protein